MRVRFWGTRGSIATPGASTLRFGGNTSCIELLTQSGYRVILDCGTGARPLGLDLVANADKPVRATMLLGHTHWDHIQGFPFFAPLFEEGSEFVICAPGGVARSLADVLAGQMEFTYFPVELEQLPAQIQYRDLTEGTYDFGGVRITTQFLNHPATTLGYRIQADGVVVVYMCDHEPFSPTVWGDGAEPGRIESIVHDGDRRHAAFMKHADLLIHDAQYTPEEYPPKKNWGHSTYEYAVELAAAADVRQLALTHHDPTHDDAIIEEIEQRARVLASKRNSLMQVFCAYEGYDRVLATPESGRVRGVDVAASSLPAASSHLRVLVVDDDPDLRAMVVTALHRDGHHTLEAADGQSALRLIDSGEPDLVLLDLILPNLDGISLLRELRAQPQTAQLPVIIMTAQGEEANTRDAFEAGATDYLSKPFAVPQLMARVRTCMARTLAQRSESASGLR
jgi:CheY-like chemotaxis protein